MIKPAIHLMVAAILVTHFAFQAEGQDAPAPAGKCANKVMQLGWYCADCKDFKQENGDCCDPCACKGCTDNKKVTVVQVCVREIYACEMGCPDQGATEAGNCPQCGSPRARKLNQAKVIYRCPKCADEATPALIFKCPKCTEEVKGKECEKCKAKTVPEFQAPGPCGKCNVERELTCSKAGSGVHVATGDAKRQ